MKGKLVSEESLCVVRLDFRETLRNENKVLSIRILFALKVTIYKNNMKLDRTPSL